MCISFKLQIDLDTWSGQVYYQNSEQLMLSAGDFRPNNFKNLVNKFGDFRGVRHPI